MKAPGDLAALPATTHAAQAGPLPPLRYEGGDLGLCEDAKPWIYFIDQTGTRWVTHSVEDILKAIDHFANENDRKRLLFDAAVHYGFEDTWALIRGRDPVEPLWDLRDGTGRLLLAGVSHRAACLATERLQQIPGWKSPDREVLYICRQAKTPRPGLLWDWRHEGPLELVHYGLSVDGGACIVIRSHVGNCSMAPEEALRRLDQFNDDDRAELLAGLALHYGVSLDQQRAARDQSEGASN